jgi:signal transduction histidine kinase
LVKNAIQSIPEQQERKTVFVTVKKDSNNVLIIVNGIGIKPEDISRIFEPLLLKQRHGIRFRYYQKHH